MSEPIRVKNVYDDTDRHLMAALNAVEVPADLQSRLERSLQIASREHELASPAAQSPVTERAHSVLWNRRNAIAAVLAAGVGGLALSVRQTYQPLTQAQLLTCTQNLLDQLQKPNWQPLTDADTVAINRSLQEVGFLRQVTNVALIGVSQLEPPRNIHRATAYTFGNQMVLLDLIIERGVQGVPHYLTDLSWSRSDIVAFAMSRENRTLIFAGPESIRPHILPAQTT